MTILLLLIYMGDGKEAPDSYNNQVQKRKLGKYLWWSIPLDIILMYVLIP